MAIGMEACVLLNAQWQSVQLAASVTLVCQTINSVGVYRLLYSQLHICQLANTSE